MNYPTVTVTAEAIERLLTEHFEHAFRVSGEEGYGFTIKTTFDLEGTGYFTGIEDALKRVDIPEVAAELATADIRSNFIVITESEVFAFLAREGYSVHNVTVDIDDRMYVDVSDVEEYLESVSA
jgi:hypothetical protein